MRWAILSTPLLLLSLAATLRATSITAPADDVVITGRVTDEATGAPLPAVQVYLDGSSHGALTRETGEYRMTVPAGAIAPGGSRLVAQRIGYQEGHAVVRASSGTLRVDFRLRAVSLSLDENIVTGTAARDMAVRPRGPAVEQAQSANVAIGAAAVDAFSRSVAPAPPAFAPSGYNREAYDHIAENTFLAGGTNPLSTFSIDVDRASYSNVRRFLNDGQLPPPDAVRVEEMVNYFRYDYPRPTREHPIAVATELGVAPWRPEHRLLRISVASTPLRTEALPPSNLVFLVDVSGSMAPPNKLPLVKRSLRLLVDELRPQDRVSIAVYAGAAGLVLPSTPGTEKESILEALDRLEAGGSTAGGAGLRLAYRIARENHLAGGNNRVILATDGDFNVGESSDAAMIRLIEEMRQQGTFLTVLGFGMGNLQDSKMQALAQHGNGNYAYIDSLLEARKVLVAEMGGTLHTVAKDVKLQVEFNPTQVLAYRLIGYENRLLAAEDFNDDAKDAGELGAGHTVTALYEIIPVGAQTDVQVRGIDPLRYQRPRGNALAARNGEVAFVRARYKQPDGEHSMLLEHAVADRSSRPSADFNFAAAVAGFGMLLRNSEHKGSISAEQVVSLAESGRGTDPEGYREEFIRLVRTYQRVLASER